MTVGLADGLRAVKSVNGTVTEYYWLNGTLYGQKTGNEYLLFMYDEDGSPIGFNIIIGYIAKLQQTKGQGILTFSVLYYLCSE